MNNIQHRYISCVEYYLLNHLNDRMDIRKLYYESYIPYYQLCKDFFNQSVSFIDYSQIPRIQKTLSAHQYITFLSRFIIPYD